MRCSEVEYHRRMAKERSEERDKANKKMLDLETENTQLRESLSSVLDIIDGPELKAELSIAYAHGYECDKEVSQRNGAIVDAAYKLLGRERPKGDG